MKLDHPDLQPFEPILRPILDIAFTGGIRSLASVGAKLQDIYQNEKLRRRFMRGCHYGYDKAQKRIGQLVIHLEAQIGAAEEEVRHLRRTDKMRVSLAIGRLKILRERQLVLRRIVDTLFFLIIHLQTWICRRLIMEDQIRRIDPNVLLRTLKIASSRNSESRYRFNVVTDLTTFAHIGDLVEVDLSPGVQAMWKVIEVKEGKMNQVLSGILKEKGGELSTQELEDVKSSLGGHASKQAHRMMAQQRRMKELVRVIETDRGIDPKFNEEIHMTSDCVVLEEYSEVFIELVKRAREQGSSDVTVDRCLRLIAIRNEIIEQTDIGAVAHLFFHMANRELPCKLQNPEEGEEEYRAVLSVPPFVDLVRHSMRAMWGRPIFLWGLPEGHVIDLVMGRIRVFAQFDLQAFFEVAAASGIKMSWIVGAEAEKLKKYSIPIPGSPHARGLRIELPNGSVHTVFSGFIARVICDLTRPQQLLELAKRFPEQNNEITQRLLSDPNHHPSHQS